MKFLGSVILLFLGARGLEGVGGGVGVVDIISVRMVAAQTGLWVLLALLLVDKYEFRSQANLSTCNR